MTAAPSRQLPPLPPRPDDRLAPIPSPSRRGRGTAVLLLVLVLAGVGLAAWHWFAAEGSSVAGPISPSTDRTTSSPTPTVWLTQRVLITVRPTLLASHTSAPQPPPIGRRPIVTNAVPAKHGPAPVQPSVAKHPASSPSARTASASFTLTCPVATTLTATGSGVGSNTLNLTGPGMHRAATGARPLFTVRVQAGSFTATDTDTGGQPSVGLRQSVPASEACHP